MTGKILLSVIAILTTESLYLADCNVTHIYDPPWSPHAKFNNAQTMTIAALLGTAGFFFVWRRRKPVSVLLPGVLLIGLYWLSQLPAFLFSRVAWNNPNLLKAWQALSDIPTQLKDAVVLVAVITVAAWLIAQGSNHRSKA